MAAGPNDLTNPAAVSAYLGQDPTLDTAVLQSLVTAESTRIQTWLGYNVASAAYVETRDGNGKAMLVFANAPVTAVASVAIWWQPVAALTPGECSGYSFDANALYLAGGVFPKGRRNISISYTAGYAAIPADLAQACVELTALRYRLRDKTGLVSESGLQQTTAYVQADMPASVMAALQPYRRMMAVGV
jgi:hypothetical protein